MRNPFLTEIAPLVGDWNLTKERKKGMSCRARRGLWKPELGRHPGIIRGLSGDYKAQSATGLRTADALFYIFILGVGHYV